MFKSPINALQEILIKRGCVPNYAYSFDISEFKCEVTCKNLSATGTGINKKEAKHNAAINMLSLLNSTIDSKKHKTGNKIEDLETYQTTYNEPTNTNISPSISEDTQIFPEYNYIGLLQELCIQHHPDLPVYEVVQESGPSHMKTFKVKCNVGSFEKTGVAHCKKTAKQEAAKNILHHLLFLNILPEVACKKFEHYKRKINDTQDIIIKKSNVEITEPVLPIEKPQILEVSEKVLSTYELISNNIAMENIDYDSTAFNDNNNVIKNTPMTLNQPKSIKRVNDCKQTLESNCEKLDVSKPIVESAFTESSESTQSHYIESNSDNEKEQDLTKNGIANLSLIDKEYERTIEDDLREFNIEISDYVESNKTLTLVDLSKIALSTYITSKVSENSRKPTNALTDSHDLFKKLYSNKIPDNLRKRMYTVSKCKLSAIDIISVVETYQEVQKVLGIKSKQVNYSKKDVKIICLRMLSTPVITQFGIGPMENNAMAEAMLAIINTILEYIK